MPEHEQRQVSRWIPVEAYEGLENFATLSGATLTAVLTVLGQEAALHLAEGKPSLNWEKLTRQARELSASSRRRRPPS